MADLTGNRDWIGNDSIFRLFSFCHQYDKVLAQAMVSELQTAKNYPYMPIQITSRNHGLKQYEHQWRTILRHLLGIMTICRRSLPKNSNLRPQFVSQTFWCLG